MSLPPPLPDKARHGVDRSGIGSAYFDGDSPVPRRVTLIVDHVAGILEIGLPGSDAAGLRWPLDEIRQLEDTAGRDGVILRWTGDPLARLHLATREQILERRSDRGLDWMQQEGPSLGLSLGEDQLPLLRDGLAEIAELNPKILALPRANLHADLFRDNVLFDGNHLTGVIDFYNACSGPMLYDLAIAVNDWCSHPNGELDEERSQALLAAYSSLRRFTPAEAELWRPMLRVACVRFWLSRLIAAQRFAGQSVLIKDPDEFGRLLQVRQRCHSALPFAF